MSRGEGHRLATVMQGELVEVETLTARLEPVLPEGDARVSCRQRSETMLIINIARITHSSHGGSENLSITPQWANAANRVTGMAHIAQARLQRDCFSLAQISVREIVYD